jgi:hypothetical protein
MEAKAVHNPYSKVEGNGMTLDEALASIDRLSRIGCNNHSISREEVTCADTQQAVRLLAEAYDHLRRRDPLYGDRRRSRCLAPPPGSVPPG